MDKQVVIVPSKKMDTNKKENRNEHKLIRMTKVAREELDPNETGLDLENNDKNIFLNTFQAFAEDIKIVKEMLNTDELSKYSLKNTCFVSTDTFKKLGGENKYLKLDISNTFSKLLIGTDPELLIMEEGEVKHASQIPGFSHTAKFGSDGPMAELRPTPSHTVKGLVDNLKHLLNDEESVKNVKQYDWISGCYHETNARDYPIGTHIHIDNPNKIKNLSTEKRMRLFAVTNKILDELLTLPMIRLDGKKGHNRRAKCKMSVHNNYNNQDYGKGYGFFGEWRSCNGHLEHRSLSGLVMLNPDICKAVFGTAKAIAEAVYKEALNNDLKNDFILPEKFSKTNIYNTNFKDWGKIPLIETFDCTTPSGIMIKSMNNSCRTEIDKKFIKTWLNKIRKLSTYKSFSDDIESLGSILSSSAKVLDGYNVNMKKMWKE